MTTKIAKPTLMEILRHDPLHKPVIEAALEGVEGKYMGFFWDQVITDANVSAQSAPALRRDVIRAICEEELGGGADPEPTFPMGAPYFLAGEDEEVPLSQCMPVGKPTAGYVRACPRHQVVIERWIEIQDHRIRGMAGAYNGRVEWCDQLIPGFKGKKIGRIRHPLLED